MQNSSLIATQIQRVLIFPARTPMVADRRVYFLFSMRQTEDIVMTASIMPVPLSRPFIKGVTQWRDKVVPVISLEECLGLESSNSSKYTRLAVVQTAKKDAVQLSNYRIMLQVDPHIRVLTLPIECDLVSDEWIPAGHLTKGVYEWGNKFLVVAHMEKILDGAMADGQKKEQVCIESQH